MKLTVIHTIGYRPPLWVALGLDCWRMREGDKNTEYRWIQNHSSEDRCICQLRQLLWWCHSSNFLWFSLSPLRKRWEIHDRSFCDRFLDQKDSVGCKCLPQWNISRFIFLLFLPLCPPLNQRSSMFEQGGQWWTRYQPVSYKLESRYQLFRCASISRLYPCE